MRHFNLFNRLILLIVATTAISVNVWGNYYAEVTVQTNPTGKGSVYVSTSGTLSDTRSGDRSTDVDFSIGATTPTGYTFASWTCNPVASSLPTGTTGTIKVKTSSSTGEDNAASYTVTANFTANTYTVTLDQQSGSGGTESVPATFDAAMPSATMPTRNGYKFNGYYTAINGEGIQYYNADGSSAKNWNITENTTLYAYWTQSAVEVGNADPKSVDITGSVQDTKTATLTFPVANASDDQDFYAPTITGDAGWTVSSWSYNNNQVAVVVSFTATENTTTRGNHISTVTLAAKSSSSATGQVTANVEMTPAYTSLADSYTLGTAPIDLSKVWTSSSNGAITYSLQSTSTKGIQLNGNTLVLGDVGTATLTLTQVAGTSSKASSATKTITVIKPTNHLEMNITSATAFDNYKIGSQDVSYGSKGITFAGKNGFSYNDNRWVAFTWQGVPKTLTFTTSSDAKNDPEWSYKIVHAGSTEWVEEKTYTGKGWTVNQDLAPDVFGIYINYTRREGEGYIANLKVTERSEVTGDASIDFGSKLATAGAVEKTAKVNWYNVLPMTLSIEGTNADQFELVSSTSIASNLDQYAENVQVKVKYKGSATGSHSATLVFKDTKGFTQKEIALSGSAQEHWDRTVTAKNINDTYQVDDTALDLATLWTISGDGTTTYSITSWTSAGGNLEGKTTGTTLNGSTLFLGEAGTLTLQATAPQTATYNAKTDTKTITIVRRANSLTANIANMEGLERYLGLDGTYNITATSTNTRTKVTITTPTTSALSPSGAYEGTVDVTTNLVEGDVVITFAQAQDYKYNAINENATIHVGQGNACTILNDYATETKVTNFYKTGLASPHILSFSAKAGNVNTIQVQAGTNGYQWTTIKSITLTDQLTTYICDLTGYTYCQISGIQTSGIGRQEQSIYMKNATITQTTTITPHNGKPLAMSKIKGEADLDSTITITHNTCGEIKVINSNPDQFTITQTASTSTSATYKVTYKKSDIAGTHNATLTFYDHNTIATMTMNGETTEMQNPIWECAIADSYNVEQTTLDLQALWTSNQRDEAPYSSRQYSIVFTPDEGNHSGATGVTLTDNRYLTLGDAGTIAITMTQDANAFYYKKTDTKTITLNRLANTMTFTLNGTQGQTSSLYLGEGMMTYIHTSNTADTIYAEQIDGSKSGTYYRNWNAVYAAATTGDVVVHAWQDQNYKYNACEGNFTISVQEMPLSTCKALEESSLVLKGNYDDPITPIYTSVLNITGEPSSTMTFSIQATDPGNADTTRWWTEYSVDNAIWTKLYAPSTKATANKQSVTIDNFPADAKYVRFGMEKAAAWESGTYAKTQHITQLTFSNISIARATYLKVGADEANVTADDIEIAAKPIYIDEQLQTTFVIAYSTCDQTSADHIRIQCNRGSAATFSMDNISTENEPTSMHTITMTYTPNNWGKDTVIVAVYNRSVRRRVTMFIDVKPYTLIGGDWRKVENWEDGKMPATPSPILITGDANVSDTLEIHSLFVQEGATLTINPYAQLTIETASDMAHTPNEMGNICIKQGATLRILDGTTTIDSLSLYGGWIDDEHFDVPRIYIADPASLHLTTSDVYYYVQVNGQSYIPLAVPFETKLSEMCYADMPTYNLSNSFGNGKVVDVCWYDGEKRAKSNQSSYYHSQNWISCTYNDTLKPGIGYILFAKRLKGQERTALRFKMTISNDWLTHGEQGTVGDTTRDITTVNAWELNNEATRPNNKAWNYIANPYLSMYRGSEHELILPTSEEGESTAVRYVNIPTVRCDDYRQLPLEEVELKPFYCFFIQAAQDGDLNFNVAQRHAAPRYLMADYYNYAEQKAYIRVSGNKAEDQMGIVVNEKYSDAYDFNADLVLMTENNPTLRTYLDYQGMQYAYLAINEESATKILPVTLRVPTDGEYTYSLKDNSVTDHFGSIILTDYETGVATDLTLSDYTFRATAGLHTERFAINATPKQTPTDISNEVKSNDDLQKILHRGKVYILRQGKIYTISGQVVNELQ